MHYSPSSLIASWWCFATLRAKNRAVTGTGCGIAIILPLCKIMYNLSMCYYFQEKAFYNRLVSYIFLPVLNNWKIIPIHTYVNLYVHMFACYVVYSITMSTVSVKKSSLGSGVNNNNNFSEFLKSSSELHNILII